MEDFKDIRDIKDSKNAKPAKEILLVCDPPFFNSVDVQVCDFPSGFDADKYAAGELRWRSRCKITVEFAKIDVLTLKQQGLDFDGAMEHYRSWLYKIVKVHIASDWKCVDGYETLMEMIENKVKLYYEQP